MRHGLTASKSASIKTSAARTGRRHYRAFLGKNAIRFGMAQTGQRFEQLQLLSGNDTQLITIDSTDLCRGWNRMGALETTTINDYRNSLDRRIRVSTVDRHPEARVRAIGGINRRSYWKKCEARSLK